MQTDTKQNDQPATTPAPAPLATIDRQAAELGPINAAQAFRVGLEPTSFDGAIRLAEIAAKAGIGGCTKADDALVRLMAGREVGLTAFASLTHVYVVNGRPSLDSITILALCLRSPLCEDFSLVSSDEKHAVYRCKRKGRSPRELKWGIEMAQRAQLVKKDSNWEKYPEAMLRARCITALARIEFPEAIGGFFEVDEARTTVTIDPATGEVKEITHARGETAALGGAQRNFDAELADMKTDIDAACKASIADPTKADAEWRAVRDQVKAWTAPEGHKAQASAHYEAKRKEWKEELVKQTREQK